MEKIVKILVLLSVIVLVGSTAYLGMFGVGVEPKTVTKDLDTSRFPK